ncbi:MAG: CDP-glucose 4,6-dehydratase [Thermodesulfobacteriota bacterium]|nr:CDP-glucose 4,6-dehydratase [Thermodesulfobacteriota bacterium]
MKSAFKGLYAGKKVLVTGHTGFKGSWLSIWLCELGAEVIGYSLAPPTEPSNYIASDLEERLINIEGDIRDLDRLIKVFQKYRPDMVIHMAAQSIVRKSYDEPVSTFATNVIGTINVMEAVRLTDSVQVLINVTSDKCYENKSEERSFHEDDPKGGYDPYSASKGCAELAFTAYQRSFFALRSGLLGAASVRAGNVVGGGDWAVDRLLPDCVRALTQGRTITIRSPLATRPWFYVLEALGGYLWLGALLLTDPEGYSGGWNFGPPKAGPESNRVRELVRTFIRHWGTGAFKEARTRADEAMPEAPTLALCPDKSHQKLGWRAFMTLDESLDETARWYRQYYDSARKGRMYDLCARQIEQYTLNAGQEGLAWAVPEDSALKNGAVVSGYLKEASRAR